MGSLWDCERPVFVPFLAAEVRCGRCAACRARAAWWKRQQVELEVLGYQGDRAWFCTFTFEGVVPEEKEAYGHVQRWIKRLRKKFPEERFRYIAVAELGGRGGRLHYHVLLFCEGRIKYRELPDWDHGFSKFKVADESAWQYVVKYCQKQAGVKLRGSNLLGHRIVKIVTGHDLVFSVLKQFAGATVVRIGKTRVPAKLQRAYSPPVAHVVSPDEPLERDSCRRAVRESSREELIGVSDKIWLEWMKSTKNQSLNSLGTNEMDDQRKPVSLIYDQEQGLFIVGNRGDTSPEAEGGPDGID